MHVLNTPPAFVLSQNQTLRKNNLICLHAVADMKILNRGCRPRGPASAHCFNIEIRCAAHNLIFFLFSAKPSLLRTANIDLRRYLARFPLSHTVKELVSRGLKSRSGGFTEVITAIDILSLGRPPSWRRAKPRATHPLGSTHFDNVLRFFSKVPRNPLWNMGFFTRKNPQF